MCFDASGRPMRRIRACSPALASVLRLRATSSSYTAEVSKFTARASGSVRDSTWCCRLPGRPRPAGCTPRLLPENPGLVRSAAAAPLLYVGAILAARAFDVQALAATHVDDAVSAVAGALDPPALVVAAVIAELFDVRSVGVAAARDVQRSVAALADDAILTAAQVDDVPQLVRSAAARPLLHVRGVAVAPAFDVETLVAAAVDDSAAEEDSPRRRVSAAWPVWIVVAGFWVLTTKPWARPVVRSTRRAVSTVHRAVEGHVAPSIVVVARVSSRARDARLVVRHVPHLR